MSGYALSVGWRHVLGWVGHCAHRFAPWMSAGAIAALLVGLVSALAFTISNVPTFDQVKARHNASHSVLLDRQGVVVQRLRADFTTLRDDWQSLADTSPALVEAMLTAEDQRFYTHAGVDNLALAASVLRHLRGGERGGSTISMQLVRLLDPAGHPRRDLRGKILQMAHATALELRWSKAQILEAYVNLIPLRGDVQGFAAGARIYFGKNTSGLNHTESALLAALVRAPNARWSLVERRACKLLQQHAQSCEGLPDFRSAIVRPRVRLAAQAASSESLAPHLARTLLSTGEKTVTSTLSARIQALATQTLLEQLLELSERNVHDGAVVVLDTASGEVLAYVGSADASKAASAVDAARAPRQAGSTLKPMLYGLALERGLLTPQSLLDDSPLLAAGASGLYGPQNYDRNFRGLVSVREALAASLNVPAVRTLDLLGVANFHALLAGLDFSLPRQAEHYGLGLALGAAEVNLLALTNAYRAFANDGVWSPIKLRTDAPSANQKRVMSIATARAITDILSDRAARASAFGFGSVLSTRVPSAVKTGTSKGMRDNWCVGYGRRFTIGVWVGNANGEPMWDVSGVSGAAPVWARLMDALEGAKGNVGDSALSSPASLDTDVIQPHPRLAMVTRIESPVTGSRFALDPDAPAHRQSITLRTRFIDQERSRAPKAWRLDRRTFAFEASEQLIALPPPGAHSLELLDQRDRVIDRVQFHVQGTK